MECNPCVKDWIEENKEEMIHCPHQPGFLRISKKGCISRHLAAREKSFEALSKNDPFYYILKSGMERCVKCAIGRRFTHEFHGLANERPGHPPVNSRSRERKPKERS